MTREHYQPQHIEEALDYISQHLEMGPTIIASDYDHTLVDELYTVPGSDYLAAAIRPDTVSAAQGQHLLLATGRRAENRGIPELWTSGLISAEMPIITENGGSFVYKTSEGALGHEDQLHPDDAKILEEYVFVFQAAGRLQIPADRELVVKKGRTLITADVQDYEGIKAFDDQEFLAQQLERIRRELEIQQQSETNFAIVNNGDFVSIQHKGVHKFRAVETYLAQCGLLRDDVQIVSMGDGDNDFELLDGADLSIGFGPAVSHRADVSIPGGARHTTAVLEVIKRHTQPVPLDVWRKRSTEHLTSFPNPK
jgi:hydroxymethylpyrimidine pyrophosphatase-like HAD family hydrolase